MGAGLPQLWCILNAIYESLWQRCRCGAGAPGSAARSDRKYSFHLSTLLPPTVLLFLLFKKDYTSQRTLAKSLKTLRNIQRHLVKSWSLEASLGQEAIKDSKFSLVFFFLVQCFFFPKWTSETTANKHLNVGEILRVPIWFSGHEGRSSVMAPGWKISSNIIISCSSWAECSLVDGLITFWLQPTASSR